MSRTAVLLRKLLCLAACMMSWAAFAQDAVVIQLKWLHQFQFAGLYAALERGYFADEGLRVTLRERDPGRNVVADVLDGRAQYGISDSVLFLHHAQGEPVVIVAAIMQHSANAIMTLADSGLDTPRDLVGRRLAFYENPSDGIDVVAMLADHGVQRSDLVQRGLHERLEALRRSEVDAVSIYVTNEPFVFREMGYAVNLIQPRHYGFDLYGDMLFTSRTEAEAHPERIAAMRRAVLRGWEYALDHKAEMVELIHDRYNPQGKSRAALMNEALGIEALISRHTTELGRLDEGRIGYIVTQLQRLDLLGPRGTNPAQLVFRGQDAGRPMLTSEERAFLEGLGRPLRVGVESTGWPPFEFFDARGEFRGIASEYLTALRNTLDVEFELVRSDSWDWLLQAARDRRIDLLPVATSTPDRRDYLSFTAPYVHSPMIIVTRDDVDFISDLERLGDRQVGVVGGYASDEMLSRYFPGLNLKRYPVTLEGLRAVAAGVDYAFVDNLTAVSHLIRAHGLSNLKISGRTPYSFDLGIGVRSDWPLVHSAIEKGLATIPEARREEIHARWVHLTVEEGFPWRKILPAALGALLLFALLATYALRMRSLNRRLSETEFALQDKNRELQALSITDKLTGAYNRHRLDAVLAEQFDRAQRYARPLALVLFDLDHFKEINDRHGHQVGDRVLQRFADVARATVRRSDVFGRWGGEEFMLICPETTAEQAATAAEKIRAAFAAERVDDAAGLTVSAGITDNTGVRSPEQFISGTDRWLYAAKQAGRNRVMCGSAADSGHAGAT